MQRQRHEQVVRIQLAGSFGEVGNIFNTNWVDCPHKCNFMGKESKRNCQKIFYMFCTIRSADQTGNDYLTKLLSI